MTGMTNRPEHVEDENERQVDKHEERLAPPDMRGKKDHPVGKERKDAPEERGRVSETGAGRGTQHQGH
jgi:hypothetical protein